MRPLHFQNSFFAGLPKGAGPNQPSRQTPRALYTDVLPTPSSAPSLLIASPETAALLELTPEDLSSPEFSLVFSGTKLSKGDSPFATRYGGHQFGQWAGQLGDGRALSLGELTNARGERWEVQLKGAGQTPYSRGADGRAVLRSSVREFLCSEAMFYLGVPTTRALSCVLTGDKVVRDMLYDGHPAPEPGAITTRVAPSFLRLGHFQILAASGELDILQALVRRTLERFHPELLAMSPNDRLSVETLGSWFREVCTRTALLLAHWTRVHFVHGVMNTDNLSVLGLTIDYGPYGWLDTFDPSWTPNTTDATHRRYRFGNQPSIALWNLARFAEALLPLFESEETGKKELEAGLEAYRRDFQTRFLQFSQQKLGIAELAPERAIPLIERLDELLRKEETDPTIFYRKLAHLQEPQPCGPPLSERGLALVTESLLQPDRLQGELLAQWKTWLTDYVDTHSTLASPPDQRRAQMNGVNPVFILRNYLVQEALDALDRQDRAPLDALMSALRHPYEETPETLAFFKKRPEWARTRVGCAALSCSS